MPSSMPRMAEQQLGARGFGLQTLPSWPLRLNTLFIMTSSRVCKRCSRCILALDVRVDEALVEQAIDTYMMVYIQGSNLTGMTPKKLQARQERLSKKDPSGPTRMCMRDIRCSVSYAERGRSNPFAVTGLDLVPSLTWSRRSGTNRAVAGSRLSGSEELAHGA